MDKRILGCSGIRRLGQRHGSLHTFLALVFSICVGSTASATVLPPYWNLPFCLSMYGFYDEPRAFVFLPDERLLIVERNVLKLQQLGARTEFVTDVPDVGLDGTLGDIVLHPNFTANSLVYLSYIEGRGGDVAVARAELVLHPSVGGALENLRVIWRAAPKVDTSKVHLPSLTFGRRGHLFIAWSETQEGAVTGKFEGTVARVDDDAVPSKRVPAEPWSWSDRIPLGIAVDAAGSLWRYDTDPNGKAEVNIAPEGLVPPKPSNAEADRRPARGKRAARVVEQRDLFSGGMFIYSGSMFADWQGDAVIAGGVASRHLMRFDIEEGEARLVESYDMARPLIDVEQAPDGSIWLLEEALPVTRARVVKLTPCEPPSRR